LGGKEEARMSIDAEKTPARRAAERTRNQVEETGQGGEARGQERAACVRPRYADRETDSPAATPRWNEWPMNRFGHGATCASFVAHKYRYVFHLHASLASVVAHVGARS